MRKNGNAQGRGEQERAPLATLLDTLLDSIKIAF